LIPNSYFERFSTKKYRSRNPLQRLLIRRFVERLHSLFIRACPVERVLEVGCGEGFLSGYLSERFPSISFSGIDLDEHDIARATEEFPRLAARVGSAYDLSQLGDVDLVICAEVLEHLETPDRALAEMLARHPKHLILTVPHEPWFMLSNFARGKNLARLGNDEEHLNHWGRRSFRALLEPRLEVVELLTSYPWLLALCVPR
jgi:2-polyprenyl-3-methyl-5-hydroxy-6-metoxy-1,4-benzoquinol methylase